jgi:hypothetical protein
MRWIRERDSARNNMPMPKSPEFINLIEINIEIIATKMISHVNSLKISFTTSLNSIKESIAWQR